MIEKKISKFPVPKFKGKTTVDVYYNGEFYATLCEQEVSQLRLEIVKESIKEGISGNDIPSGYTIKCYKDTNDETNLKEVEIVIDTLGNLSGMPYEFAYNRRSTLAILRLLKKL